MAISNVDFQVRLFQTVNGQPSLNVFWYRKDAAHASGDATRLAAAFNGTVNEAIADVASNQVTFDRIEVINLADPTDYWSETPMDVLGNVVSTSPAPSFLAYSFRLLRSTRAGRNGYKRIGGVAEELVAGGSTTVSGALTTAIPALEFALFQSITNGGSVFGPRIPHRQKGVNPMEPNTYVLVDLYPIASVDFVGLTTQSSRKAF